MNRWMRAALIAVTTAGALAMARAASAQEFVKVDEAVSEQIPAVPFVGAAYAFIWVAVLVYVVLIARRMVRLRGEMDELQRRLAAGDGAPRGAGASSPSRL